MERLTVPHTFVPSDLWEDGRCRWCPDFEAGPLHTAEPIKAVVVLTFTDWREAAVWAKHAEPGEDVPDSARVVGLFRVPTQFCSCLSDQGSGDGNKVKGWALGPKFGWWVHRNCGKPAPAWAQNFGTRLFGAFGHNFLPNAPEHFTNPVTGNRAHHQP